MGISTVHLHGVDQHSGVSTAKNKLDRVVEVLKTSSSSGAYVVSTNHLASSESVVISETEQRHQSLIVCTI